MPEPDTGKLVIFDFDGTVAIGDAPVQAYLAAIVERLEGLDVAPPALPGSGRVGAAADGYAAIGAWASAEGVPEDLRRAAYASSRAALHEGRIPVEAPAGLADLLERRPSRVRCVLVTNAPVDGIEPLLERLGLGGRFDALIGDARKPAGLPTILERLLEEYGLVGADLLAVGDVWGNDLEPAAALGAATAHIDRFDRGDGDPTFRAASTAELLPDIEGWWAA